MPLSAFRIQGFGLSEGSHPHALERLCQGSVVGVECLNLVLQARDLGLASASRSGLSTPVARFGFRVKDFGFRAQGVGFREWDVGYRKVLGGLRVKGSGCGE